MVGDAAAQAPVVPLSFDRYHGYAEIKALLDRLAAVYPRLARVYSIGRDYRGFAVWAIEITNRATGAGDEKPGFYADGNIDADEPSSTEVILHLSHRVLTGYGRDSAITRLLDRVVLYLVPTVNPFMSDLYVSTPMTGVVSSINARPRDDDGDGRMDEDPPDDVNGDGRIVQMRIPDRSGAFRTSPRDRRVLVRGGANEPGEWRVVSEGVDDDGDGAVNEDPIGGVDLNRNFPFDWKPEPEQDGAGPYPLSEPETRSIVEFVTAHPNIGFVVSGHSGPDRGLIYRPYGSRPDSAIPREDFRAMEAFAARFAARSGGLEILPPYGAHAQRRFGRDVYGHGFEMEWAYEQAGAYAFSPEHGFIPGDADRDGRVTDEELIQVSDREFGGLLFVPWTPFAHPTLGPVEIGGFVKFTRPNPPPGRYLDSLVRVYGAMYQYWAETLPRLLVRDAEASVEADRIVVRAVVENAGRLPTNVTAKAVATGRAGPVVVTLATSPGVELVEGERRDTLGYLPGTGLGESAAAERAGGSREVRWTVRAPAGPGHWVEITGAAAKAGTARVRLSLTSE
jgi:hypothetical protein